LYPIETDCQRIKKPFTQSRALMIVPRRSIGGLELGRRQNSKVH
jgi:hypothetical protein